MGQLKIGIFLTVSSSEKRYKIGTLLLWKVNRQSYALYGMIFPMTMSVNYPKTTPLTTFYVDFHIFINTGDRDFKFCK